MPLQIMCVPQDTHMYPTMQGMVVGGCLPDENYP